MNMSVHASNLFKGKTLLNQMEEKFLGPGFVLIFAEKDKLYLIA